MKGKRQKQYRKLIEKYSHTFGHRPPYQVLIDAAIIQDAAKCKMRLGSLLEGTLHGEIKPMITQCCIRHLYNAPSSPDKDGWIEVAKQAERRRCGHHELEEPLSTLECLKSVVDPKGSGTNKHRYSVASQDQDVRRAMRNVAGVPLIYINRSVMILEPMSAKTEGVRDSDEKGKIKAGLKTRRATGTAAGEKRKREDEDEAGDLPERARAIAVAEAGGTDQNQAQKKRKIKGPKGPNPLSVKKAKDEKTKKPVARQVEGERSAIRKASKKDPQADEKAMTAEAAADGGDAGDVTQGARKRKRKRRPKDGDRADIERPAAAGADDD